VETDYVVVGAGSAGCVVAARLSAAGYSVALLEAGPRDHSPFIHIPAGVGHLLYDRRYNWMYASEPEQSLGNRAIHSPRGKVLGGSSSINGMLYVRGNLPIMTGGPSSVVGAGPLMTYCHYSFDPNTIFRAVISESGANTACLKSRTIAPSCRLRICL